MSAEATPGSGALVVVGTGIELGRHVGQRTVSEIQRADVVFCLTDVFALAWLREHRPDLIPLHDCYGQDKDRRQTYREMTELILAEVRAGRRVVAVFYGHPAVFADVPHAAVRQARVEGYPARMEAGVSAADCLYADLGVDPGAYGVQSFEATQFLIHRRRIDPSALLILWQVALCGDLSCRRFDTTPARLQVLVDRLLEDYPRATEVILYEAAQLPIQTFRADRLPLVEIPEARYREYTTLVIPPAVPLIVDAEIRRTLEAL